MTRRRLDRWPLILMSLVFAGCSLRLGDFTALSTKNVPLRYDATSVVEGRDCRWNILGIPLGFPNLKEAVDEAIDGRGNALVNEVTYQEGWSAFFVGQACFKVKGEVVTLK